MASISFLSEVRASGTGLLSASVARDAGVAPGGLPTFAGAVLQELCRYLSAPNSLAILSASATAAGVRRERLAPRHLPAIVAQVQASFGFFGIAEERRAECVSQLRMLAGAPTDATVSSIAIRQEADVVRARLAGKALCRELAFSETGTSKVVAAISELARNVYKHAGKGSIDVRRVEGEPAGIEVVAVDGGPGIANVDVLLRPTIRPRIGAGAGLRGVRDAMDFFDVVSSAEAGTIVTIRKHRS